MTAGLEVMEVLVSRLTDLCCLEERARLAELGRNHREPREARWDNNDTQSAPNTLVMGVNYEYLINATGHSGQCEPL